MAEKTRMTDAEIGAIEARVEARTPGKWGLDYYQGARDIKLRSVYVEEDGEIGEDVIWPSTYNTIGIKDADADLIVNAPADLVALLAEVKAARGQEIYWHQEWQSAYVGDDAQAALTTALNEADTLRQERAALLAEVERLRAMLAVTTE